MLNIVKLRICLLMVFSIVYIYFKYHKADILTKGINGSQFLKLRFIWSSFQLIGGNQMVLDFVD